MAGTGKQMHQGEPDVIRIHRLNLVPQSLQIQMVLLRSPSAQHSPHSIPIGPKQIAKNAAWQIVAFIVSLLDDAQIPAAARWTVNMIIIPIHIDTCLSDFIIL